MKLIQILGHNSKWNIDSFIDQSIGDKLLITAFTFGERYLSNKNIQNLLDQCMIDLQFYGKKSKISTGKLNEFSFHPINSDQNAPTNIPSCIVEAIKYQQRNGFKQILIPLYYDDNGWDDLISIIKYINSYVNKNRVVDCKYYMTLPLAYDIIRDKDLVDNILFALTDMNISFDGYYIVCENKPEQGHKITTDLKLIKNLSLILKTLKLQNFETIYSYANWDAIIYLAQTDIDYITIGTYENLRNFSIKRFTEDISGGASEGYYFSEKLLNMIRAKDVLNIAQNNQLSIISNTKNIFSDIILGKDYIWNIHKPDINKNYLVSVSNLLKNISSIPDIKQRIISVLFLIEDAIRNYQLLDDKYIVLAGSESKNYHLDIWKQYLLQTAKIKPAEFDKLYESHKN